MNPFTFYPDMKTKYSIETIDLRHQSDHITPQKIQLFHEYGADPENARFYIIKIRRRKTELILDGIKLLEVKPLWKIKDNFIFERFFEKN